MPETGHSHILQQVIETAGAHLAEVQPMPTFSPKAFEAFKSQIDSYIGALFDECLREAKRHRSDSVSEANVERASDYLVSHSSRKFSRFLGFIGGILLGAAVSRLFSMTITGTYSGATIALTGGVAIVGALLTGLHFAMG